MVTTDVYWNNDDDKKAAVLSMMGKRGIKCAKA